MAIDIREISLTEEQKRRIAELADATGQSWAEVLERQIAATPQTNSSSDEDDPGDRYIRDPKKRMAFFHAFVARQTSHNPEFDDSRESIYFGEH